MDGQLNLFDLDMSFIDKHFDRYGKSLKVPQWLKYERCENCVRWVLLDSSEQPPSGWGVCGFCQEHKQRCYSTSYCMNFEDKRAVKER